MDVVGDEGERGHQAQNADGFVLASYVSYYAIVNYAEHHGEYGEQTDEAGFCGRADEFAVGVAAIAEVCGDDGQVAVVLEGGVAKLIAARSPAHDGTFFNHSEGGVPAVESFHVGGIGADVGDGLKVFRQVPGGVLAVARHAVHDVIGKSKEGSSEDDSGGNQPR